MCIVSHYGLQNFTEILMNQIGVTLNINKLNVPINRLKHIGYNSSSSIDISYTLLHFLAFVFIYRKVHRLILKVTFPL